MGEVIANIYTYIILFKSEFPLSFSAQTFGPICGAHLNPAVTVGLFIKGAITLARTLLYFIVQLIGGMLLLHKS